MTLIELAVFKYTLAPLAVFCCIVAAIDLRILRGDLKVLDGESINGGKRYSAVARMFQGAFLLAVSVVLLVIGGVFWLAELQPASFYKLPQVMVERVGINIIALLILWKQWNIRQTRIKLDDLYDQIEHARRGHRRATDPPDVVMTHLRDE